MISLDTKTYIREHKSYRTHAMSFIYSLLLSCLLPFFYIKRILDRFKSKSNLKPKLKLATPTPTTSHSPLWIHAVSVGEVNAAFILLRAISTTSPQLPILITSATAAGIQQARQHIQHIERDKISNKISLSYPPYDLPIFINRFLKRFAPRALVIMEADIWRNTLRCCRQQNIPTILANARLNQSSLKRRQRFSFTMPRPQDMPNLICAQSSTDAQNFSVLGKSYSTIPSTTPSIIKVCGNIKFDAVAGGGSSVSSISSASSVEAEAEAEQGGAEEAQAYSRLPPTLQQFLTNANRIWIAASTHAPEEDAVLDAHIKLLQQDKSTQPILLILAPRHSRRFAEVARLIRNKGLKVLCLSEVLLNSSRNTKSSSSSNAMKPSPLSSNPTGEEVLLVDTIGDLPLIYKWADFAFVGGSLASRGGHNILEPLALQVPVILGPHHHNLIPIINLINEQTTQATAIHIITNKEDMVRKISEYASMPRSQLKGLALDAKHAINANRGASATTAALIDKLL